MQPEQQMDDDVAGTGAPSLPAAIRHALMIMSHLLPGRPAERAAEPPGRFFCSAQLSEGGKKKERKKSPFSPQLHRLLCRTSSTNSFPSSTPSAYSSFYFSSFSLSFSLYILCRPSASPPFTSPLPAALVSLHPPASIRLTFCCRSPPSSSSSDSSPPPSCHVLLPWELAALIH